VPDENVKRLLKAIKECPKTANELEAKTTREEKKGQGIHEVKRTMTKK
jgi:hypothetical protein